VVLLEYPLLRLQRRLDATIAVMPGRKSLVTPSTKSVSTAAMIAGAIDRCSVADQNVRGTWAPDAPDRVGGLLWSKPHANMIRGIGSSIPPRTLRVRA
jgi:hypothetical protein